MGFGRENYQEILARSYKTFKSPQQRTPNPPRPPTNISYSNPQPVKRPRTIQGQKKRPLILHKPKVKKRIQLITSKPITPKPKVEKHVRIPLVVKVVKQISKKSTVFKNNSKHNIKDINIFPSIPQVSAMKSPNVTPPVGSGLEGKLTVFGINGVSDFSTKNGTNSIPTTSKKLEVVIAGKTYQVKDQASADKLKNKFADRQAVFDKKQKAIKDSQRDLGAETILLSGTQDSLNPKGAGISSNATSGNLSTKQQTKKDIAIAQQIKDRADNAAQQKKLEKMFSDDFAFNGFGGGSAIYKAAVAKDKAGQINSAKNGPKGKNVDQLNPYGNFANPNAKFGISSTPSKGELTKAQERIKNKVS